MHERLDDFSFRKTLPSTGINLFPLAAALFKDVCKADFYGQPFSGLHR